MIIESKYNIGDTVYGPSYESRTVWSQCPDCKGTLRWRAITSTSQEFEIDCPTCMDGRGPIGKVGVFAVLPLVRALTIGRVSYDTDFGYGSDRMVFKYMCEETGVGSGAVYTEDKLYLTREEALIEAQRQADEVLASTQRTNDEQRDKRIKLAARHGICAHCEGSGRIRR
jgi:hypothetical protein